MSFGSNNSDTTTTGSSYDQNYYDPDRAYLQSLMAYEMYGPEAVTGTQFGYYDPRQSSNPMYESMPSWDWSRQPLGPNDNSGYPGAGGMGSYEPLPNGAGGGQGGQGGQGGGDGNQRGIYMASNNLTPGGANGNHRFHENPDSPFPGGPGGTYPGGNPNNGSNPTNPGGNHNGSDPNVISGFNWGDPTLLQPTPQGWGPMVRPGYGDKAPIYQTDGSGGWGQGGASGNRRLAGGRLYGAFSDMVSNPDLDPSVKDAITVGANQAANAQYDAAEGQLSRYGRTTGNRAGNAAAVAQLGMDRANTAADVNRNNLIDFEQMRRQRQAQGLQGISGLYSGEGNYMAGLTGQRGALDATPIGRRNQTSGTGNFVGSNFGFSIM